MFLYCFNKLKYLFALFLSLIFLCFSAFADEVELQRPQDPGVSIEKNLDPNELPPLLSVSVEPKSPTEASKAPILETPKKIAPNNLTEKTTPLSGAKTETAMALRIVLGLTFLAILPALLVSMTAFLRIVIVLSMLRHAIGMQETPPNMVLIGLAIFMTLFTMSPVIEKVNNESFKPFMENKIAMEDAAEKGMRPIRDFMIAQAREADISLMIELSHAPEPKSIDEVSNVQLIPAFMLSELKAAFQIGFLIFLPFLLIDLIVSSILMGLGMMMMPPTSIALPIKILLFILVDGWSLVMKALVGSFH